MTKSNLDSTKTSSYDFFLPEDLIAKYPATPADSARLLIYDRKSDTIKHDIFKNILDYIDDCAVVLNNTKVIKARIFGHKSTGAKIELLINKPLVNNYFLVYIRGKVKLDDILHFDGFSAKVIALNLDGSRVVEFYDQKSIDFDRLIRYLDDIGHVPLPPYINRADIKQDEQDYQTLFAKYSGSVAAPTASLHFTDELLARFRSRFDMGFVTLHVGAGTFKPVDVESIDKHIMHSEQYLIDDSTKELIESKQKLLAVGTTVTRTIEFYHRCKAQSGECNLFLNPNNPPQRVDYLLTNFHLPKSTLIMLVASFVGVEKTLELYNEAIKNKYRFYSYGDAMLVL
ncbi:MAG: tRNA preQ1(34) S-adenosylmethionine ribosyltransferase-isomerase QueA [Arcobacteraceae bacterium]|jgi:S-adenosylmethionine:tRNA ribosyltransferase-isomerase|nr:tRNA preQ1(34) S-adenosylmethionine ribosyltransferase-isomerase QueA [Arcobacteraceae bacterium]